MDKCYEYFDCKKYDCVMRSQKEEIKCWELEGTLCHSEHLNLLEEMAGDKCLYCIYHKSMHNPAPS